VIRSVYSGKHCWRCLCVGSRLQRLAVEGFDAMEGFDAVERFDAVEQWKGLIRLVDALIKAAGRGYIGKISVLQPENIVEPWCLCLQRSRSVKGNKQYNSTFIRTVQDVDTWIDGLRPISPAYFYLITREIPVGVTRARD